MANLVIAGLLTAGLAFAQTPTARVNADIAKLTEAVQQTAATVATLKAQVASMAAPMASQLADFALTYDPTTQFAMTIGAQCSHTTPCNARIGAVTYSFVVPIKVTTKFGTDFGYSGLVYVYIDHDGILTMGSVTALQCDGVCRYVSGVTSFPLDSMPLWRFGITNGQLNQDAADFRAFLSTKNIDAGTGVLITDQSGASSIGIDSTMTMIRSAVPMTAIDACIAGQFATDESTLYLCVATDSWIKFTSTPF